MIIDVRTLGVLKNVAAQPTLPVTLPEGPTVSQLRAQLLEKYPPLRAVSFFVIVVNNALAAPEVVVQPTDQVVVMSPISGG